MIIIEKRNPEKDNQKRKQKYKKQEKRGYLYGTAEH